MLSILIGALAVAAGMGISLSKANADRERLSDLVQQSAVKAERAQTDGQLAIEEANRKIEEAKSRVDAAQETIKAMQEERDLMAKATVLPTPVPAALKGWKEAANMQLGISLKYPAASSLVSNDFSLTLAASGTTYGQEYRWFDAEPYQPRLEEELADGLVATTSVSIVQHGRLLLGLSGTDITGREVYVLHLVKDGTPQRLIWARDPFGGKTGNKGLQTVLATLQFAE